MQIDNIVKEMIEKHEGGEKFFEHLDKAVQQEPILDQLLNMIGENTSMLHPIVLSGGFGRYFHNTMKTEIPLLVVNGGLRKGEPVDDLSYLGLTGVEFIFIDDSFYSGKTRDAINQELEKHGAKIVQTFVIYDGSLEKDDTVHSLYRYHR